MPQGSHRSVGDVGDVGEIHDVVLRSQNVTLKFLFFRKPLRNWDVYKMGEAANGFSFFGTCPLFVLIKVTRGRNTEKQCHLFQR